MVKSDSLSHSKLMSTISEHAGFIQLYNGWSVVASFHSVDSDMVKCTFPGWPARLLWKGTFQEVTTCIFGCLGGEVNRQRWVMNLKWLYLCHVS